MIADFTSPRCRGRAAIRNLCVLSLAGLSLLLHSTRVAHAFVQQRDPDGNLRRIDFQYTPVVQFHLGTTGSAGGVLSNEWNNVRAAFAQWEAVPGTVIRFQEGNPIASTTQIPVVDGRIDILWVNPGVHPTPALGGNVVLAAGQVAVAAFVDDETGVILQGVILLNRNLNYLTGFEEESVNRPYLESVVLHEIGHLLGLNHAAGGSATLWWFQGGGVGAAAGLSTDEIAFAQSVYGTPTTRASLATVRGVVRRNGTPILAAVVSIESPEGSWLGATLSQANGSYELPGLPPGNYRLRVNPLDSGSHTDNYLVRAAELDIGVPNAYAQAVTDFLPTPPNEAVSLTGVAGQIHTQDLNVSSGSAPYRITSMRVGLRRNLRESGDEPLQVIQGQQEAWIGVYIPELPPSTSVELRVSGEGIVHGETELVAGALRNLTLVQAPIDVANDAPPGMRSVTVSIPGRVLWANGFVDVRAAQPDYNFDDLDDLFQRRYFHPFTLPEAGPEQDPDGDGYVNRREAAFGTDPTRADDFPFLITDFGFGSGTVQVVWEAVPGRHYQVWSRSVGPPDSRTAAGPPVQATQERQPWTHPDPAHLPSDIPQLFQIEQLD